MVKYSREPKTSYMGQQRWVADEDGINILLQIAFIREDVEQANLQNIAPCDVKGCKYSVRRETFERPFHLSQE